MLPLLAATLDRQLRVWFFHLVSASPPVQGTGKTVLCMYVSNIDRIIRVDEEKLREGIRLAAACENRAEAAVRADIAGAVAATPSTTAPNVDTPTGVLAALAARMRHAGNGADRVRVVETAPAVLDFLNAWYNSPPAVGPEQLGGAPAIIAEVLTQLGEPSVVIWTPYHSEAQAKLYDPRTQFLGFDARGCPAPHPIRPGHADDPHIQNYPLEFAEGRQTDVQLADGLLAPTTTDRVIAISPGYAYYRPDGVYDQHKNANKVPPIKRLLCERQDAACHVGEVAERYRYWILGGMQNVKDAAAQAGLGADLAGLPPGVTVHTELSGGVVSAWYLGILTRYVHSLGVNAEELADACACVAALQCAADTLPQDSGVPGLQQEYLLRLAAWLLEHLALERIYIHGHTLDFVVRWAETSDEEMAREVRADLLAKIVVTNKARGRNPGEPIARPLGLPRSGLAEYVDLCELRAFPVGEWIEQASMAEFERILDRGWFESAFVEADRERVLRVAVLPVALFHPLPPELRFVGAGDTTSAVSFIYSCFTAASALRAAQPRDVAGQPA